MKDMRRKDFSRGWMPSADAVNAPQNALLRADNLILDELGILSLRLGSTKIYGPFGGSDVDSVYTAVISGTRYRMNNASTDLIKNGSVLQSGAFAGSGDVAFGSYMGQIFAARSTSKWKYDGTTLRTWGIAKPAAAPTVVGLPPDSKTFGTFNGVSHATPDSPAWVAGEGSTSESTGQDAVANSCQEVVPNATTGRGTITKTWPAVAGTADNGSGKVRIQTASAHGLATGMKVTISGIVGTTEANGNWIVTYVDATHFDLAAVAYVHAWSSGGEVAMDFTYYDGTDTATDDDLIDFYIFLAEPQLMDKLQLMIDVNAGNFQEDYYWYEWVNGDPVQVLVEPEQYIEQYPDLYGSPQEMEQIKQRMIHIPARWETQFRSDKLASGVWNHFTIQKSKMSRSGSTAGKNWSTVKSVRLTFNGSAGGAGAAVRFDSLKVIGGATKPLTGKYKYRVVAVKNLGAGKYQAKSIVSDASSGIELKAQGSTVTLDYFTVVGLATQVDELWFYRFGGFLDRWYRVGVITGGPWIAAQNFTDTMPDRDALILNEYLDLDNTTPPDNIIDIAGPYYTRMFCLTSTHVHPSRRGNPDSFSSGQAIQVADGTETTYWIRRAMGGLYIGTSKDIYRLEGTGDEFPDGTFDMKITPLNNGNPPISNAVAQEGDILVYLAADGFRVFTGSGSEPIRGDTDLLFRGYTRHGVSPVNITSSSARFRAAISKGVLTAIIPEGADTTKSKTLYRFNFSQQRWYRHTYPVSFKSIAREPDGTIVAGDDSGNLWQLDSGTVDGATAIPVVLWSMVDDDGLPDALKDPWDFLVIADTGGVNATVALHLDGSGAAAANGTLTVNKNGMGPVQARIDNVAVFRQVQLRVTGSFQTFKWFEVLLRYRDRSSLLYYSENKPIQPSARRRRFAGLALVIDTLNAAAAVVPVLDGVDQASLSVTSSEPITANVPVSTVIGRDLWGKVACPTGFELYGINPIVIEELPQQFEGLYQSSNFGYDGDKVISGLRIKACTLNALRTFTPILDGASFPGLFNFNSGNEPDTHTCQFTSQQTATDIAFSVDGLIELYEFQPIVLYNLPRKRQVWDTGNLDLDNKDINWVREIHIKAKAVSTLTVTPYFDDVAFPPYTVQILPGTTIYEIPMGREYKGRSPRAIVTSVSDFTPYWMDFVFRSSGRVTQKKTVRVKPL